MKITIYNSNEVKTYDADEGAVLTINKDETLDSAVIKISNLNEQINAIPLDMVNLTELPDIEGIGSDSRRMLIENIDETITCLNPKLYSYEISLFSCVKDLEGVRLPSLKITKLPGVVRSIYYYIEQYFNEYCPLIKRGMSNTSWNYTRKYFLDPELVNIFSDECPEMQWNTPTFRDVLNDLMMVKDCIVVVKDGFMISYMKLTEIKESVDEDDAINRIDSSLSADDFVSELQVKLENVTDKNQLVTRSEWFPLYTDDSYMTTENFKIKTQLPIYKIKKLEIMFVVLYQLSSGGTTNAHPKWIKADLCKLKDFDGNYKNFVYEAKEWQTKRITYRITEATESNLSDFQNFTLYYNRGGTTIEGLNRTTNGFAGFGSYQTLEIIKNVAARGLFEDIFSPGQGDLTHPNAWSDKTGTTEYYVTFFHIEYETLAGNLFRASKGQYPGHDRIIQDNQTNSYVDSKKQGALEYMKANRLGNKQLRINATYRDNNSRILQIGDTYNKNNIIYRVQYQIYNYHIEVNAISTKDYVLRNYYTGVKAKLRSWKIVDGSDALTRHDLIKFYGEFSWRRKDESNKIDRADAYPIARYLCSSLDANNANIQPIKYCFVRARNNNIYYPSPKDGVDYFYLMDVTNRIVGNSMCFTVKFDDNYWAGKSYDTDSISKSDIVSTQGNVSLPKFNDSVLIQSSGVPIKYWRYCDDNGENTGYDIIFAYDIDESSGFGNISNGDDYVYNEGSVEFIYANIQKPYVSRLAFQPNSTTNYEKFFRMLKLIREISLCVK